MRIAASLDELLAGATAREPMAKGSDSKSGARFERAVIGGEDYIVKIMHVDDDWLARATGDLRCRPLVAGEAGIFEHVPDCIDHATVGMARGLGRNGWGAAVLMRDVAAHLVPAGNSLMPLDLHLAFMHDMAALHAAFWNFEDTVGLQPLSHRVLELTPFITQIEAARGGTDEVPPMLAPGWERLRTDAPVAADVIWRLLADPDPLVRAIEAGPSTLVHGDWKAGNLGAHPDGRTILLDWAVPGQASPLIDLTWYLAVNCDRLPQSKESTIEHYRACLEGAAVSTDHWWDAQLDLAIIVAFMMLGWSKSGEELAWWADRVTTAAPLRLG